jgi:hypothetical protein
MDDRKDSDLPEEPRDESRPPEMGEDPGMVEREPVRRAPEDRREEDTQAPGARVFGEDQSTEIPPAQPTDIDPTADPLPYRGQTVEPDQPYQSRGMPVQQGGMIDETPMGIPGEDPLQPTGPREPTTTGTSQPVGRGDRTIWLLIIIAAVVFCIVVLALLVGGVFASPII